jgi:hypothetical protein
MIISLPVHTEECRARAEGAVAVDVASQVPDAGLYLPPVLSGLEVDRPPQTIISVDVQTADAAERAAGAFTVERAVHVWVTGS